MKYKDYIVSSLLIFSGTYLTLFVAMPFILGGIFN
uniref:ORF69 n=1 Tax=Nitrosopumilaceae spindle-shaped virus TaxID=3065433 RepID=A0AAT9JAH5_9VIRU